MFKKVWGGDLCPGKIFPFPGAAAMHKKPVGTNKLASGASYYCGVHAQPTTSTE